MQGMMVQTKLIFTLTMLIKPSLHHEKTHQTSGFSNTAIF